MGERIHHSNVNNRLAKINTGGMGIKRKEERGGEFMRYLEEIKVILRE